MRSPVVRAAALLGLLAAVSAPAAPVAAEATVSIACGSVGIEFDVCKSGAEAWAARTGNRVRVVSTPKDSNEILALYQQLLSARSADVDVLRIDTVWPGILAPHLTDLAAALAPAALAQHFDATIENDRIDGKLVALPWFADVGLLYYRKDLLEKHGRTVPTTWQELTETARVVQEAERKGPGPTAVWGYVFQGRAYEGLTCNALEWIHSFGGGTIVDAEGRITVDDPKAVEALALAASWVGAISPRGVLNYGEEEARGAFQSGRAVFMRNWPYAWALVNGDDSPVRGKVGVTRLPKGGPGGTHAATLGGWHLAVSRYSRQQAAAVSLAAYLTGPEEQKRAALVAGLNPTIERLYRDQEILDRQPFQAALRETFLGAVARPSRVTGDRYNPVSSAFWSAVHATLAGQGTAEANLRRARQTLERLRRRGGW